MFWYDDELQRLGQIKAHAKESPKMVFYGSSSIRLWSNLYNIYKDFSPINLGFGGSTLAACSWYFDKIFSNIDAKAIVIYAGDNDISDGRHPEEIVLFFMSLFCKYGKSMEVFPFRLSLSSPVLQGGIWQVASIMPI